jgi:hypothetical protein
MCTCTIFLSKIEKYVVEMFNNKNGSWSRVIVLCQTQKDKLMDEMF